MTMDRSRESNPLEHMPLEEVRLEEIDHTGPPAASVTAAHEKEPYLPPVLIEEEEPLGGKRFTLLAHHRSFWKVLAKGHLSVRALVVRSSVHIGLALDSIDNCIEEAMLFQALLRNGLVDNRSRLSEMLGYSRARITQILNLLKLPEDMRERLLLTDEISEFQLRPLVRVTDRAEQEEMFRSLLESKLTGRQMALFAETRREERDDSSPGPEEAGEGTPDIEELMSREPGEGEDREQTGAVGSRRETSAETPETGRRGDGAGRGRRSVGDTAALRALLRELEGVDESEWEMYARERGAAEEEVIFLRGVARLRLGLYSEAMEQLEIAVEQRSDLALGYFFLGKCCNLTGRLVPAEGHLRAAIDLIPDDADFLAELAMVLEKLKRHTEASSLYRRAGQIRRSWMEERQR